jgi:hypothetical protein
MELKLFPCGVVLPQKRPSVMGPIRYGMHPHLLSQVIVFVQLAKAMPFKDAYLQPVAQG